MITYTITKDVTCTDSLKCADTIRLNIETPALKLHVERETDTVNGSINIYHVQNKHVIRVTIYDTDEAPNTEHASTLKRPTTIPTKIELRNAL